MAVFTKKWSGSAWITVPFKKWSGSAWIDSKVQKWSGSAWVQIYPDTLVTRSQALHSTTFNTYRSSWDGGNVAKQGPYSTYASAHGYLGVSAANITGSKSITSIGSANFAATRDGSGGYNTNQTVRFHRSNVNSTSQSPVNTMSGQFNSTTGGPGSGKLMNNRAITINTEVVNWMNQISSKPYLYIYSSSASDYLGMNGTFTINLNNYVYTAKTIVFEDKNSKPLYMSPDVYKSEIGNPYHAMTIYNDEMDMTLSEIMKRREDGIVECIPYDTIDTTPELKPWTREYDVFKNNDSLCAKIEVFNLQMDDEVQYSLDKVNWNTMYGNSNNPEDDYMYAELPNDFNKYSNIVYVRIIDKVKNYMYLDTMIEPKIYIPN